MTTCARLLLVALLLALSSVKAEPGFSTQDYVNINNAQLEELIKAGGLLIDIRRPDEWRKSGVIAGSETITLFGDSGKVRREFFEQLVRAAPGPDIPIGIICRTGRRSSAASRMLKQLGYERVYNVSHGITSWIEGGRSVEPYPGLE